jgi:hypothetical protein
MLTAADLACGGRRAWQRPGIWPDRYRRTTARYSAPLWLAITRSNPCPAVHSRAMLTYPPRRADRAVVAVAVGMDGHRGVVAAGVQSLLHFGRTADRTAQLPGSSGIWQIVGQEDRAGSHADRASPERACMATDPGSHMPPTVPWARAVSKFRGLIPAGPRITACAGADSGRTWSRAPRCQYDPAWRS